MSWWDIDDPTPERLLGVLGEAFMAHAQGIFAHDPRLQTILMTVAQYWADNASDEVHCELLFSPTAATPWPHECARHGGADPFFCELCLEQPAEGQRRDDFWLPGVDALKRAVEPFCLEGATQFMSTSETSLPFFVLRRGAAKPAFVGQLQRPWLRPDLVEIEPPPPDLAPLFAEVYRRPDADEPRLVLADCLQAAGDPRGTFIALQLHPNPTPAMQAEAKRLEDAHRNAWLGALLPVVSPARCRFTRGFVSTVALGPAPPAGFEALADSPAWATVDTVAFPELEDADADHAWTLLPAFRQMRRIEAPEDVLEEMAAMGGDWALEALHCTGTGSVDAVHALSLPGIERLMLEHPRPGQLAGLARLPWWARLTQLDLVTHDPVARFVEAVSLSAASVQALLSHGLVVIRRTEPRAARIHLHAFSRDRFATVGDDLRAALPADWRVDVAPGLADAARSALLDGLSTIGL